MKSHRRDAEAAERLFFPFAAETPAKGKINGRPKKYPLCGFAP